MQRRKKRKDTTEKLSKKKHRREGETEERATDVLAVHARKPERMCLLPLQQTAVLYIYIYIDA